MSSFIATLRRLIVVRRHCQCGGEIRTSTRPVTHSSRVERCCGEKVTHIVKPQPLIRGLPLSGASTNRASTAPIPLGTTGLLITRSPVCPDQSSLCVSEPFDCNLAAATTAVPGCGKTTPKRLPCHSGSPRPRPDPSNAPRSISSRDATAARTDARTLLRHVGSAIPVVTDAPVRPHRRNTARWYSTESQKGNGTLVALGVYFQMVR